MSVEPKLSPLEKTSASETNLVYFLKPILSPIIAYFFLKEVITANMWLGIVLFLIGSAVAVLPGILALRKAQSRHDCFKALN